MTELFGDRSGWAGAGLLGAVLFWLFTKYLPARDRQIKELVDSRDRVVHKLIDDFGRDLAAIGDHVARRDGDRKVDFDRALDLVAENSRMNTDRLAKHLDDLRGAIEAQRGR